MKIRWVRVIGSVLTAVVLLAAVGFVYVWVKLRGTPVDVPSTQASAIYPSSAPQEMRLWPGKAPGSEDWTQQETVSNLGERIIRNVVDPTLTAYFPPAGQANGTAVIVCPGGGFHMLTIDGEGTNVARYLNSMGVTAFVLRYRLTKTNAGFFLSMMHKIRTPGGLKPVLDEMSPLILADGEQALRIVRTHAAQWGVAPDRIGMMGFSAGGYLALSVAFHHGADSMPNFVAPIYALAPAPLPANPDRIPMFLACAADDPLVPPAENSEKVYDLWHGAGIPAELHVFPKGGHGFGIRKQNLPSDEWTELFRKWMEAEGLLPSTERM